MERLLARIEAALKTLETSWRSTTYTHYHSHRKMQNHYILTEADAIQGEMALGDLRYYYKILNEELDKFCNGYPVELPRIKRAVGNMEQSYQIIDHCCTVAMDACQRHEEAGTHPLYRENARIRRWLQKVLQQCLEMFTEYANYLTARTPSFV